MAIVLPDGIFGNDNFGYIRQFLQEQGRILAVIDVPIETFSPNTTTKTSILLFQKLEMIPKDYPVFMAIAQTCGHDKRGKPTDEDDILNIPNAFNEWRKKNGVTY